MVATFYRITCVYLLFFLNLFEAREINKNQNLVSKQQVMVKWIVMSSAVCFNVFLFLLGMCLASGKLFVFLFSYFTDNELTHFYEN